MNPRPDFAEIANEAIAQPVTQTWFIVSQVKSHRVVYFTDDPDYTPPTEGDWYYVSPYQGELPRAMSLRNCWGWRFNGMEFVDAREGKKPGAAQTLLASNKEALHKLLSDKIDALRKPLMAGSVMGHTLRALRLEEARAILNAKAGDPQNCKLLPTSAAARGISLQAMASRTVDAHDKETRVLLESEVLRDALAEAIDAAGDQQQLMALRRRLQASVNYTLSTHVENLTLTGSAVNGTGNALANTLTGNASGNTLNGGDGNDVLDGQAGNDVLAGGAGNDTFLMGRGYGADTVQESDATAGNSDQLQFLGGIAANQLWFGKSGNNLQVSIIGTADTAILQNWYLGNQYHVEQIRSGDGKVLQDTQVDKLVQAMAGFAPPAMGQTALTAAQQTALAPVLAANWH